MKFLQVMGECRSERPRKQTAPGFRKGELTGCGSVTPHTTKAALTSSVLFLPVLRTLKGDFTRAAKGAVSPGVHIVIF
ncbi:hypothetical protein KXT73_23010, partial [Salmonella enterica subsp. enterica serovar Weltevreden]|nr:hypothetical protein [Salmonella enterica subsp. enterica serovar Weltevreden]